MNDPVLSIVTGTVDRQPSLVDFIRSVVEHTHVPYELLIIDAGEHPVTVSIPDTARVIAERPRKNFTAGYNAAFAECRGEFVLWMNDDVEVTEGYDSAAIDFMRQFPAVGLGCLMFKDPGDADFKVCEHWGMAYSNFGIISRTLGESIGWFDSDIAMYGSDNAITCKVLLSGHGVAPIKDSRIIHHRVLDRVRRNNQVGRMADNRVLTTRYQPHIRKMQRTFWKLLPESELCGYA